MTTHEQELAHGARDDTRAVVVQTSAAECPPLVRVLLDSQAAAVFLLDLHARVLLENAQGRRLMARSAVLRNTLSRGVLTATGTPGLRELAPALRGTMVGEMQGDHLCFAIEDAALPRSLCARLTLIEPARAPDGTFCAIRGVLQVVDCANDRALPHDYLRAVYGLTNAECEVAAGMVNGASIGDLAVARRVSADTVRKQLKSVFDKTATGSQVELVRVLSQLAR